MGDLEAIRTLHAAGADLKRRDSFTGQTPLQAAQAAGHAEMIQFLHEHGGDPATYAVRSLIRQMRSANSPRKPAGGHAGPAPSGDADGSGVASAGDDNEGDDAAASKAGGTGLAGVAATVAETASASRGGSRRSLTRQTSFLSPPSAIYLNRTVISTPAGDLSLEDVFNEVKQEGQRKISVTRELPMALTIMGLYWSPQVRARSDPPGLAATLYPPLPPHIAAPSRGARRLGLRRVPPRACARAAGRRRLRRGCRRWRGFYGWGRDVGVVPDAGVLCWARRGGRGGPL